MAEDIRELSLEDTFEKLDELMEQLSDDELPLEASFDLYKQGMEMLSHCKGVIDEVEKKVRIISETDPELGDIAGEDEE